MFLHAPEDARLPAFRRVLLAAGAREDCHWRLAAAGLATPEQVHRLGSIAEALERLAPSSVCAYPPVLRRPRRQQCLSGRLEDLLGTRVLARRSRRVSVWRSVTEAPLSDADRDRLWERFQLPVFEQIRSPEGGLLAWECDAREGLHVEERASIAECVADELVLTSLTDLHWPLLRVRTGRRGELARSRCECGDEVLHWEGGEGLLTPPPDTSCDIVSDVSR